MAITLEEIELPDLVWDNEFSRVPVVAEVDMSLGGTPIIWEQAIEGLPIDLVGGLDTAWILRSVLSSLRTLARVPEALYTLSYEGSNYVVRFRHEDSPVIEASPVVPRPNHEDEDWYNNVRIKLMEV